MAYFQDIKTGIRTTLKGLSLTLRHLRNATKRRTPVGIASDNYFDQQNGLVTLTYPHEQLPIPDNGRYRLRNEIDDCIVCDKCAKVCPVECITIDAIKATEEVGRASDGSPIRLYAATFDIDMAKCCYCGLCTVVCPTECLTMDKKFDYSEFDLGKLTYHFAELTPEEADEKRTLYEQFVREKEEAKAAANVAAKPAVETPAAGVAVEPTAAPKRPVFKPTAKPVVKPAEEPISAKTATPAPDATPTEMERIAQGGLEETRKPVFRPTQKPVANPPVVTETPELTSSATELPTATEEPAAPKPKVPFRPTMKPPSAKSAASEDKLVVDNPATPTAETPAAQTSAPAPVAQPGAAAKPKPAFKPTMKPAAGSTSAKSGESAESAGENLKPAFRPTMKPAKSTPTEATPPDSDLPVANESTGSNVSIELPEQPVVSTPDTEPSKPKPAFRPTMRLKPKADDEPNP